MIESHRPLTESCADMPQRLRQHKEIALDPAVAEERITDVGRTAHHIAFR